MNLRKIFKMDKDEKVELTAVNAYQVKWYTPSERNIIDKAYVVVKHKVFINKEEAEYFVKSMKESIKNIESEWSLNATITDI